MESICTAWSDEDGIPACIRGMLWKESPSKLRVFSQQKRFVTLTEGRLEWCKHGPRSQPSTPTSPNSMSFFKTNTWSSSPTSPKSMSFFKASTINSNGQEDASDPSRGLLDFRENPCVVEAVEGSPTKFLLRPSQTTWSAIRGATFTSGRDGGRIFYFDAKDSEHDRDAWIEAIQSHIEFAADSTSSTAFGFSTSEGKISELKTWMEKEIKAIAIELEGLVEEFAQIASFPDIQSMKQDFSSMKDEVNLVKDNVKDLASQMEELAHMSEASRLQCEGLASQVEELVHLSKENRQQCKDDVNQFEDAIKDLVAQMEDLAQMCEANRLQCEGLADNLASSSSDQSITYLKDDMSNVQQEVRNLTGRMEELSKSNERIIVSWSDFKPQLSLSSGDIKVLAGEVEELAQMSKESQQQYEMNQIKDDVKDMAAQIEELARMGKASRWQCKSLAESLASSSNSQSIISLKDEMFNVQQDIRNLTGRMDELSKLNERGILAPKDFEEQLSSSSGDIKDLATRCERALALHCTANQMEELARMSSESRQQCNDEMNHVKDTVKDLGAQMDELALMSEASRLQCKAMTCLGRSSRRIGSNEQGEPAAMRDEPD